MVTARQLLTRNRALPGQNTLIVSAVSQDFYLNSASDLVIGSALYAKTRFVILNSYMLDIGVEPSPFPSIIA
jgi:hypothetical protein